MGVLAGLVPARAENGSRGGAAPAVAARDGEAAEQAIVVIVLNGVPKGEFFVLARPDGDYLVAEDDLAAMGVHQLPAAARLVDGRRHHSLRELGASELRLDEIRLELHASLPPALLPAREIDLAGTAPPPALVPEGNSVFLNYLAQQAGVGAGGPRSQTLATEIGVAHGSWLLRNESLVFRSTTAPTQRMRQATTLSRDERKTLRRWEIGDLLAEGDELGSRIAIAGIGLSKSYQIDPYLVRHPTASLSGTVLAPAEADIYLDGLRIGSEKLPPGPFELRNLGGWGGRRDLTVVIRDSFGREQRIVSPQYFTPTALREGLHEYAYSIGLRRLGLGDTYRGWVASAVHRYGFSDRVTLGGHLQAETGRYHFGPTLALRSNRRGVLSGSVSAGRGPAGTGWAALLRHNFQARTFGLHSELRRQSSRYHRVGTSSETTLPTAEFSTSASHVLKGFGDLSVNAGYRQLRTPGNEEQHAFALGLSRRVFGTITVSALFERHWGREHDTRVQAILNYSPRPGLSGCVSHTRLGDNHSETVQFGTNAPLGEGLGYRVVGQRWHDPLRSAWSWSPSVQYNSRHGSYSVELQERHSGDERTQQSYLIGAAGGLAWVGDTLALTRPITDSFAGVQVGSLEGVRVYQNAEFVGRTDTRGRIFLPNLGSYLRNTISIDDRDIPIEYRIPQRELTVSPALRSGAIVRFEVERQQTLTGRIVLHHGLRQRTAAYSDVSVKIAGRETSFPTGAEGEFYIDGLPPGRHTARLRQRDLICEFELTVPVSPEMLLDLGEVHACRPPP